MGVTLTLMSCAGATTCMAQPAPQQLPPPPVQQNRAPPPPRRPLPGGGMAELLVSHNNVANVDMIEDPVLLGFGNDDLWIAVPMIDRSISLPPTPTSPASAASQTHRPRRRPR